MARVLGIDGGGTSTRAVLTADGKTEWTKNGNPANLASTQSAITNLKDLLQDCPEADAVCGAFAGLLTEEHAEKARVFLQERFPNAKVCVVADYMAALEACGDAVDICVIAGTGSLVCSRVNGKVVTSGGRGYLLGDEGSAYQYGRDALLHFLDAPDHEVTDTLRKAVESTFGTRNKSEMVSALYASEDTAKRVASLSEAFAKDAESGAIYALKSLRIHPGKLAHVVAIHLRMHHPSLTNVVVGCQGGLWLNKVYREAFTGQLSFWCKADTIKVDYELPSPVYGAVQLAEKLLDGNGR